MTQLSGSSRRKLCATFSFVHPPFHPVGQLSQGSSWRRDKKAGGWLGHGRGIQGQGCFLRTPPPFSV
eukprot:77892-Pelagomonas_calceolata.AAC.5